MRRELVTVIVRKSMVISTEDASMNCKERNELMIWFNFKEKRIIKDRQRGKVVMQQINDSHNLANKLHTEQESLVQTLKHAI